MLTGWFRSHLRIQSHGPSADAQNLLQGCVQAVEPWWPAYHFQPVLLFIFDYVFASFRSPNETRGLLSFFIYLNIVFRQFQNFGRIFTSQNVRLFKFKKKMINIQWNWSSNQKSKITKNHQQFITIRNLNDLIENIRYTWLESFTPKEEWIGAFKYGDNDSFETYTALKELLQQEGRSYHIWYNLILQGAS